MSGRYMDSHMPYRESGAVPATMKSCAVSIAPIVSMPQRYGVCVLSSRPAITGDTKYGPNLQKKKKDARMLRVPESQISAGLTHNHRRQMRSALKPGM